MKEGIWVELNWLQSLLYGAVSGFSEFLPIDAGSHRKLLLLMMGAEKSPILEFTVHLACLLSLVLSCWPQLFKLQRERRLAMVPTRHRKRQPDLRALKDMRFLRTALIPLLAGFFLVSQLQGIQKLWHIAALLVVNGVLLYIPPYFPSGNKDSQTVSGLDGLLVGMGGVLGVVPGISRITGLTTVGLLRGCDRSYILDMGLLLSIPALAIVCIFDIVSIFTVGAALSGGMLLSCALALTAAFAAAYFGIMFIRFLAVKVGFSGFAYYSWGAALFAFILFLTI